MACWGLSQGLEQWSVGVPSTTAFTDQGSALSCGRRLESGTFYEGLRQVSVEVLLVLAHHWWCPLVPISCPAQTPWEPENLFFVHSCSMAGEMPPGALRGMSQVTGQGVLRRVGKGGQHPPYEVYFLW